MWLIAGCCFVICPSREEADKAVDACHNKRTLPGVSIVLIFNLFVYCGELGQWDWDMLFFLLYYAIFSR